MDSKTIQEETPSSAAGTRAAAQKVTWRDKPLVAILSKVSTSAALVISFIGLVLYFAVDGKGMGLAYKYAIATWCGGLGVLFGVPGIVCSKDKTVRLIATGCTASAFFLILLGIASVLNLKADEENGRYFGVRYSKSYDRIYDGPGIHSTTGTWGRQEREYAKDVARKVSSAIKAIEESEYEASKATKSSAADAIDVNTIRSLGE